MAHVVEYWLLEGGRIRLSCMGLLPETLNCDARAVMHAGIAY